jgi:putative tricarboxylic transport membrane protein
LLAGCAIGLIVKGLRGENRQQWLVFGAWMQSWFHLRNFLITVGCLLFYILVSSGLGFILTAILVLCTMFWALEVKPKLIVPVAVVVTLVVHTIFYKGLRVPLPWGILLPIQW